MPQRSFWGGRGGGQQKPPDFDPEKDYYAVLGLEKGASEKDIKNMYYKKCFEYHPDRTGGMHQDKFKEINSAYDVLSDEKKKKEYDELRDRILNPNKHKQGHQSGDSFRSQNRQWQNSQQQQGYGQWSQYRKPNKNG